MLNLIAVAIMVIIISMMLMMWCRWSPINLLSYVYYWIRVRRRYGPISSLESNILVALEQYRPYPFPALQHTDYEVTLSNYNKTCQWLPNVIFNIVLEYKDSSQPIEYHTGGKGIEFVIGIKESDRLFNEERFVPTTPRILINVRDATVWLGYCPVACLGSIDRILIPLYFASGVPMKLDLTIRAMCQTLECPQHVPSRYMYVDTGIQARQFSQQSIHNIQTLCTFMSYISYRYLYRDNYKRRRPSRRTINTIHDPVLRCQPGLLYLDAFHIHIRGLPPDLLSNLKSDNGKFARLRVDVRLNIDIERDVDRLEFHYERQIFD